MEDKTIIAAILLLVIGLIQTVSFIMGHNGQVVIITSNILVGISTYYFAKAKFK